jgi:hypothetical protein
VAERLTTPIHVRFPEGLASQVREAAEADGRTVTSFIRAACNEKITRDAARAKLEEMHGRTEVFELHLYPAHEMGAGQATWKVVDPAGRRLAGGVQRGLRPEVEALAHIGAREAVGHADFRLEVVEHGR